MSDYAADLVVSHQDNAQRCAIGAKRTTSGILAAKLSQQSSEHTSLANMYNVFATAPKN